MSTIQRMIERAEDRWPDDASAVPDDTLGQVLLASHLLGSDRARSLGPAVLGPVDHALQRAHREDLRRGFPRTTVEQ